MPSPSVGCSLSSCRLDFVPGALHGWGDLDSSGGGTVRPCHPATPRSRATAPGAQRAGRRLGAAAWGLGELRGSAPAAVSLPVYLVIPRDLLYPFTLSSHGTKDQTPGGLGLPLTLVVHRWLGHSVVLHVSMGTKHVPRGPHESNSQNVWRASRAESRGPLRGQPCGPHRGRDSPDAAPSFSAHLRQVS
uniref:Uncharacterized protein n=1 Tax=Rangifer tarandus platyrhynchus TaxID=3082113 RepID=A0ACB0F5E3_RANTA|nr:unnamed protein product [Rangifer tarandus platyrhynchus]